MKRLFALGMLRLKTLTARLVAPTDGAGGAKDQRGEKYAAIYDKKSDAYA